MKRFYKGIYWFAGAMIMAWLGNYFYDETKGTVKDIPILKYLIIALNWLYDAIIATLNFPIKVWVLLLAALATSIAIFLYKRVQKPPLPKFNNYRKDVFKNWIWRWDYKFDGTNWKPANLTPYCPKDDVQLILGSVTIYAKCPKCEMEFPSNQMPYELAGDIRILIQDKINKGTYPKAD